MVRLLELTKFMILRFRPRLAIGAFLIFAWLLAVGPSGADVPSHSLVMYLVPGIESGDIAVMCTIQSVGPCALKPDEVVPQIHDIDGNPTGSNARFVSWPAAAQPDSSNASVGFRLIRGDLNAGMYHAVVYAPQSLRSQVQPEGNTTSMSFSIANPLRMSPSVRVGQTFVALPSQSGLNTRPGVAESGMPDGLHGTDFGSIFTITRIEEQAGQLNLATLESDRAQSLTVKVTSDVASLQDLVPLADDIGLQHLREVYEGKLVWGRGGLHADCAISNEEGGAINAVGRLPFRIRRIVRAYGQAWFNLGYDGPSNFESDSSFAAMNPLIVLFDKPARADVKVIEHWSIGISLVSPRASPLESQRCTAFYAIKADVWDFERTYSTVAPEAEHPDWPTNIVEAIYSHDVLLGMTHDMVAWSRGYPSFWGSIAYLNTLHAWKYPSTPPFHYWAYFKRGKLVKFEPDGRLP